MSYSRILSCGKTKVLLSNNKKASWVQMCGMINNSLSLGLLSVFLSMFVPSSLSPFLFLCVWPSLPLFLSACPPLPRSFSFSAHIPHSTFSLCFSLTITVLISRLFLFFLTAYFLFSLSVSLSHSPPLILFLLLHPSSFSAVPCSS